MASRLSTIESHPQRSKIIAALAAGTPYRDISAWAYPAVTATTLCRFKRATMRGVNATLEAARVAIAKEDKGITDIATHAVTRAALTAAADPFVSRILKHQATLDGEIQAAAGDGRTVAALVSTDLKGLELQARLAGRLDAPGTASLSVQIVYPAQPRASEDDGCVTIDLTPER